MHVTKGNEDHFNTPLDVTARKVCGRLQHEVQEAKCNMVCSKMHRRSAGQAARCATFCAFCLVLPSAEF